MDGTTDRGGLVLTVKAGEQIVIGEGENEIIVTPHEFDRGRCRLHFSGPKSVKIDRMELRKKKLADATIETKCQVPEDFMARIRDRYQLAAAKNPIIAAHEMAAQHCGFQTREEMLTHLVVELNDVYEKTINMLKEKMATART